MSCSAWEPVSMGLDDADVERVVAAVAADVMATLRWSERKARRFVMREGCVEAYADQADDVLTLAYQVMGNVQESIQEDRVDTSWPECPVHRRHPLSFEYDLVWRCPAEDTHDPAGFFRGVPLGWLDAVWR